MTRVALAAPDLDVGADRVVIAFWQVEVGEHAEEGEAVVELIAPGLSYTIAAPVGGLLVSVEKPAGAVVLPGEVLGWIEPTAEDAVTEE